MLTTGRTCLAGIADFRPHPAVVDPGLPPAALSPVATAAPDGRFTDESPPTGEGNRAWTHSVEFL